MKQRGRAQASARLRAMTGPEKKVEVGALLFAMGNNTQVAAQISITTGAVSGKNHVPSAPGQPPNNDTGVLANNIETIQERVLKVVVESTAPYAGALEYGTSKMEARPYMAPAVALTKDENDDMFRRGFAKIMRGERVTRAVIGPIVSE